MRHSTGCRNAEPVLGWVAVTHAAFTALPLVPHGWCPVEGGMAPGDEVPIV